ncbi:MAG: hypothetical protein DRH89_01970 [Candidatus Cloacimonadota bacterium]|nr:MAG: hypothetical protein DRH89_01970 [Candidatus Cloacimonadota bacterium]
MRYKKNFEFESEQIKCYTNENIGIIKFKSNVFDIVSNLDESNDVFQIFKAASEDSNVKLILFLNDSCCFSEKEYSEFLNSLIEDWTRIEKSMFRQRQINILNRFIMEIINLDKIVVSCLSGNVVIPFFGTSLSADFRYASEDMVYSLSHLKHKVHPSGALPYFLPKYVGFGKANELLFSDREISAREAMKLGLINEILPKDDFERHCIREVQSLIDIDPIVVKTTKHLLRFSEKELSMYFQKEINIC